MSRTDPENRRQLFEIADSQGGYFTSKQAQAAGYSPKNFGYHVKSGSWIHDEHAIYRLRDYPIYSKGDLAKIWLWSRNRKEEPQAVFSHGTALALYDLTDYIPKKIHITVPRGFRKGAAIPVNVIIHKVKTPITKTRKIDFLPVADPLQAISEVCVEGTQSTADLYSALEEAIKRGLITIQDLRNIEMNSPEMQNLVIGFTQRLLSKNKVVS